MNVALPNGQQVEFPDGTRQEVIDAYLKLYPVDQKPTEEPGIGGRILGHLSKGAANTVQMLDNLASYDTSGMMQQSPETKAFLRNNRFARAVDEHPEKTWYGKLGAGLVEFVPEMPLYAAGEGIALRGLSALPKVGKAAQWLTKAHPNEWGATNLVKGMGRAAIGGAAVGGTIGVDSSASLGEHLVKGVETGAEFGVAVGGLHYPMKGLGLVGKSIFRRLGKKATPEKVEAELEKRAEKDPKAAEELQALRNARADAEAEKPKVVDEGDLYVPGAKEEAKQGELFVDMPGEAETKKLNELGFDNATIEQKIREGKDQELIDALEKEVPAEPKDNVIQFKPKVVTKNEILQNLTEESELAKHFAGLESKLGVAPEDVTYRERVPDAEDTSPFATKMKGAVRKLLDDFHDRPRDIGEGSNPYTGNPTSDIRLAYGTGQERVITNRGVNLTTNKPTLEHIVFFPKYVVEVFDTVEKKWVNVEEVFNDANAIEAFNRWSMRKGTIEKGEPVKVEEAAPVEAEAPVDAQVEKPVPESKGQRRQRVRLEALGYSMEDIAGLSSSEKVEILKNKTQKPVEEAGETTSVQKINTVEQPKLNKAFYPPIGDSPIRQLEDAIRANNPGVQISLAPYINANHFKVGTLHIPEAARGQGTGTKIVQQLKEFADKNGLTFDANLVSTGDTRARGKAIADKLGLEYTTDNKIVYNGKGSAKPQPQPKLEEVLPPEKVEKAKEQLPKVEEFKNEEKPVPTEESKEAALDRLEEKTDQEFSEDDEIDWDMLRDLEATGDPVAKALVEDMPSNELQFQDKLEGVIKDVIYKRQREKVAKKAEAKAEGKKSRGKKAEEAKPVEKVEVKGPAIEELQKDWEKLLEDEGLGMEAGREELPTESLESSFREDDIHGLDFSDRSARFFDDISDGVYRDSDGGYTLDNLGFHQIYEKLAPHVAKSATALYHMGKYVYMEGYKSFEAFAKRLKEVTGEAWNSVRRYARDAYNAAKEWNERLGEGGWIRVGQGGGAKYDRVSDEYIGTGEGRGSAHYTGAYGWGHYFSSMKAVFEAYAERFGFSGTRYKIGDKILEGEFPEDFKYDLQDKNTSSALEGAKKYLGATKQILKRYEDAKANGHVVSKAKKSVEKWQDIVNILSEGGEISFEKVSSKHVHEFDLPDELNLMDLDKPISSSHSDAILTAIQEYKKKATKIGDTASLRKINNLEKDLSYRHYILSEQERNSFLSVVKEDPQVAMAVIDMYIATCRDILRVSDITSADKQHYKNLKEEYTKIREQLFNDKPLEFSSEGLNGSEIQASLQRIFGGKGASKFLDEKAGIHGNTYIGDRWATEGEGARNYVIFADKHIPPPVNHYTLDLFGMEQIWEWGAKLVASRRAQKNAPSNGIIAEVNGKTLTAKDDAEFNEGFMRALANGIARATRARLMTPDFAYKDNERVSPLIFDLHKRLSEGLNAASKRNEAIRVADTMLREVEDRQALKRIIEGKEIPKSEKLRDAALIMRKEHEAVREKKKDSLRVEMLQNLNKHEFAVIAKVLAGKDIAEAIAEYTPRDKLGRRMKSPIDRAVIEDIVKDYKAIDNWGLDNYFTHYEKGSLRIVSGGKLYAKAMSVEDAARKFIDLNKMYPELDFKLDTTNMIGELASGVSKRSYQLIHNDLVKGLESTLGDINKAVARRLANKALEGRFFVKPTKQFSPYTLDRRAKLQGEADPFEIVYHYMYSMEKKMALDPAIDAIRRAMARTEVVGQEPYTAKDGSTKMRDIKRPFLTDDEAKYLETYVSDVKGRMYKEDEIVDGILKGFASPRAYSRFVAKAREIEANLKFAYRPVAGFVNGMSGLGHVWTKVGARYTTEGAAFLRTEEGKAFIKEMEPYLGVNIVESATGELTTRGTFERMRLLPTPKTKVGEFGHKAIEPMAFFQAPELPVRKLTLAANYLMAKSEGMSEAAARDVAIKANWFQQFSYDIASLPELMRGPTGRLLTQFKPYLLKELEFISQLRGMEIARYAGMQIALGGPRGLIMLAKSVPILGAYYGWGELENYLNKEFPKASRGVGGALGVDISAPATFQFPQAMRDWLGPTLSDLMNLYTNVLSPTIDNIVNIGNPDNPDIAIDKTMKSAIPIFKHYANLWDQVVDKDGWVKDDRGRRLWHIDNMATFTAKSLAGAESLELARIRVYESNLRGKEKRLDDTKTDTVDNILDAIESGKPIEQSDIDQMIRLGIKPQTLRRAYKFRVLDPKLRRALMTEVIRRPEILEEYPDAGDLDR